MGKTDRKLEKAVKMMNDRGLDGLIIFSRGNISVLGPSYLHYFAGVRLFGRMSAAIVTRSGDVALLVGPSWDAPRVARKTWIGDVRGTSTFPTDVTRTMKELGISGTVGLVGQKEITEEAYIAITSVAKVEPAEALIEDMAREKSPEEIEQARIAAKIADIGFEAFLEYSRPGQREYELAAEMEYAMRLAGADDIFILLSSGSHNDEMHEPMDRRMAKGDIVIGEITPIVDGLFFQLCRTVVIGRPEPVVSEKYDMLMRALNDSVAVAKPGAPAGVISKTMNKVISDAGYGKYCYPPYMRARGHGFGVGSIAPGGVIDDNTAMPLELGQVVVIHPNQYIPETGYLACGETYLVTEKGAEKLAKTETKLYTKEV
jgi:Xaa-Pro dipeptidase